MDAEQKRKQKELKHNERIRTKKILGIHFMRRVIGRQAGRQAAPCIAGLPFEQVCLPELAGLAFRILLLFTLGCW